MPKFMILHNAPKRASQIMAETPPEQQKASMQEWMQWKEAAEKKGVKFEWGMPLEVISRVTPDGVTESDCPVSGYSKLEADSKELVEEVIKGHPQLKMSGASVDILEVLPMEGMEA